jgi:hypothetical protein
VNRQQVGAFLWLHWRLRLNQFRRAGALNAILLTVLLCVAVVAGVGLFVAFFLIGLLALPQASPVILMYVWDGLAIAFLFSWCAGLLAELQRSEFLSLEKFLHLPVSLGGIFLFNYLSSLLAVSTVLFVPAMIGCSLGLVFSRGPMLLMLVPMLGAFLLMVTAVTYQFQGWLASLMVSKRRRRTIIVIVTFGFVLLMQMPNLFNVFQPLKEDTTEQLMEREEEQKKDLLGSRNPDQLTPEMRDRLDEIRKKYKAQRQEVRREKLERLEQTTRFANLVFPPGWLPLGAVALAEGRPAYPILVILAFTAVGGASLWRSYQTTVRLYTGQFTSGSKSNAPALAPARDGKPEARLLVERKLPWISEQASAIAFGGLRGLLRAPEVKMLFLTPVIFIVIFAGALFRKEASMPEFMRPLLAVGAISMVLLTMTQLLGNQFGFDRGGYRVFVLCPARRRDILLGKNLAVAPMTLGLGLLAAVVVEILFPMRLDYFLGQLPQLLSLYLLFCLLANCLSILVPTAVAAGSLRPINVRLVTALLQISLVFLLPIMVAPILLPVAMQLLLDWLGWLRGVPIGLVLSWLECLGVVYLYRVLLDVQGNWLQYREQKILEVVATKVE